MFSALFLFTAVRKSLADVSTTTSFKPRRSGAFFYGSFAFRIGLSCLPTFKPNGERERHSHGKASTNQHHTNFHRHQHHLLLPQIIGQDRY